MWLVLDKLQEHLIGTRADAVEGENLQLGKIELQLAGWIAEGLQIGFEAPNIAIYYLPATAQTMCTCCHPAGLQGRMTRTLARCVHTMAHGGHKHAMCILHA